MGIIKAATGSVSGVMADQWLEVYACDSMPAGVLAMRGVKKTGGRSANTKGEENVISDGSTIIVNVGQCALAIDKGQITGCYDQPGENTYRSDRSKSIFAKGGLKGVLKQSFDRFGYGGVAAVYQSIMFLDVREHMGNEFRVSRAIHLKDRNTDLSVDATVTISGVFSFTITDPVTFYRKVCANSTGTVHIAQILPQITAELNMVLMGALAKLCEKGISAYEIGLCSFELTDKAAEMIDEEWTALRGFSLTSIGIDGISITKGDKNLLQSVQLAKALTDPRLAAATLAAAQSQAMQYAAKNRGR